MTSEHTERVKKQQSHAGSAARYRSSTVCAFDVACRGVTVHTQRCVVVDQLRQCTVELNFNEGPLDLNKSYLLCVELIATFQLKRFDQLPQCTLGHESKTWAPAAKTDTPNRVTQN